MPYYIPLPVTQRSRNVWTNAYWWRLATDSPSGWELTATADFNSNGDPDYVLYNAGTRQTAICYLNNNLYVASAWGPTFPVGVESSAAVSEYQTLRRSE